MYFILYTLYFYFYIFFWQVHLLVLDKNGFRHLSKVLFWDALNKMMYLCQPEDVRSQISDEIFDAVGSAWPTCESKQAKNMWKLDHPVMIKMCKCEKGETIRRSWDSRFPQLTRMSTWLENNQVSKNEIFIWNKLVATRSGVWREFIMSNCLKSTRCRSVKVWGRLPKKRVSAVRGANIEMNAFCDADTEFCDTDTEFCDADR